MAEATGSAIKEKDLVDLIVKAIEEERFAEAEATILRWRLAEPFKPLVWLYSGYLYRKLDKLDAAYSCYMHLLSLDPENTSGLNNLGNLLVHMGRADQGADYLRKALAQEPESIMYKANLSYALRAAGAHKEAIEIQRELVALEPENDDRKSDLGLTLFHDRQFDEGWALNEYRFRPDGTRFLLDQAKEIYNGQSLKGKKLLIVGEQGFGDTLLMVRFIKILAEKAGQLHMIVRKPLFPLLESLGVICHDKDTLQQDFDMQAYDYAIELMSIAPLMEPDWCKWPESPKFPVPEESRKKMEVFLGPRGGKINVGIIWSGSVTFKYNLIRAVEFTRFLNLSGLFPDLQFYSLQKGPCEQDLKEHGCGAITPIASLLNDFGDSAAALEHMDLILMTDSGLAHLAGCQQVPVLNLLSFFHYWLYYPKENTTPLYESWRFIRQPTSGDWDGVFDKVKEVLGALSKAAAKSKKDRLTSKEILKVIDKTL